MAEYQIPIQFGHSGPYTLTLLISVSPNNQLY